MSDPRVYFLLMMLIVFLAFTFWVKSMWEFRCGKCGVTLVRITARGKVLYKCPACGENY